ncbi:hypothetical protein TVAG_115470 [Trichomonas vaginalis G3]|uniref:Uncharacterized protein n=1 Tax=Trichomonas vaginalis (strain ATCC PRA-98 / G3) TaxID=412133 RepID=A2F7I5_TRIV3|nr:translocon-associated protein TRAP, gamma subunit family [Trichomonas vaginalis G3]EAX99143.1 hypothetical protein TVAG_115470 [Trichomonas vaginalis G3]KAI5549185.1 translocon-associated protein TRAP, gamma subunit family [Trichomonas vaginalis G3]|eukprot:XP_001312073.1 hypothetical protein [Trichomonas vaginalis G3]
MQTEDQQYEYLKSQQVKKADSGSFQVVYIPFGLIFSGLTILLYLLIGGCTIEADKIYLAVSYGIGAVLLTIAYSNVAKWCHAQKKMNGSPLFFSLAYNNAFFVFLLIFCATVLFPGLKPAYGLVLTQTIAVAIPAWLSTLQV